MEAAGRPGHLAHAEPPARRCLTSPGSRLGEPPDWLPACRAADASELTPDRGGSDATVRSQGWRIDCRVECLPRGSERSGCAQRNVIVVMLQFGAS